MVQSLMMVGTTGHGLDLLTQYIDAAGGNMRIPAAYLSRGAVIVLAALLLTSSPLALAAPATPEIAAKQAEASAAQAELDRMNAQLEVQVEQYNAISEELERIEAEIDVTKADLERAQADLSVAQKTLAGRASSIYKDGGSGLIDVFLGARSFDDFIVRLDLMRRISRSDADIVARVKESKSNVEAQALALDQRQIEQRALFDEAATRAAQIEAEVKAQKRFVDQLTGEVKALIAAEEERQRKLAEERARQAALAAQAAARRSSGSGGRTAADPSALGGGHPEVVPIALRYIGVPYAWGGGTPSAFDCSGLTQYCYREIGISLPRTSQSQYGAGQHVAASRLDLLHPGDLVFFGTDADPDRVHHVGIYAGDGNYVHAPYTGASVRVDSLTERIATKADYVGASRF